MRQTRYKISLNILKCFKEAGLLGIGFFFLILTTATFELRTSEQVINASLSGVAVKIRLLEDIIAFLIISFFLFKKGRIKVSVKWGYIIILYVFLALISSIYSVSKIATLGKSFELLLAIVYILLALQYSVSKLLGLICIYIQFLIFTLIIASIGFILKLPGFFLPAETGWSYILGGKACAPYISANGLGYISSILFAIFLVRFYLYKGISNLIGLILSIWGIFIAGSRTSFITMIVTFLLFLFFSNRKKILVISFPIMVVLLFLVKEKLISFLMGYQNYENFLTLSGRLILWEYGLSFFEKKPFLGYGFGIGSRYLFASEQIPGFKDTISTVHNGFLEVLLGLGIIGGVIFLAFLLIFILYSIQIKKLKIYPFYEFYLIFIPITIISIMSVGLGGSFSFFFFYAVAVIFYMDYLGRYIKNANIDATQFLCSKRRRR